MTAAAPNRLARILSPDGVPLEHLRVRADERVQALAPAIAAGLDVQVQALLKQCRRPDAEIQAEPDAVFRQALCVAETAVVADQRDLALAAIRIGDLLDRWIRHGEWRSAFVQVQTAGLALLASNSLSPADRERLTEELAALMSPGPRRRSE